MATAHAAEHAHPSLKTYVDIAIILAIITGVEVLIYYIDALSGVLVPALLILSAIKFITVVGYFMHLKFDSRLLTFTFGAALVVSIILFIGLFAVMHFDAPTVFNGNMSIFADKPSRP